MFRLLLAVLFSAAICAAPVAAQNNELSFSAGGGRLIGADDSKGTPAYTLAYTRYLTERWAVEGSLEVFYNKIPQISNTIYWDDYAGLQASALYHLRPAPDRRFVPYLTAGIGFTSTDITEIPAVRVIRLGGGFKYFFGQSRRLGLRVEARNEIINDNGIFFPPEQINFPSARVGVVYRF
ncbi:MAG TPA: outer membrane beta-barrel protein [Blastocatellia bacterium]|nr:outer membrane beta-barrel protein [Blastocatellia bacterium]